MVMVVGGEYRTRCHMKPQPSSPCGGRPPAVVAPFSSSRPIGMCMSLLYCCCTAGLPRLMRAYRLFSTSSHGVFSQVESSDGCQQTALTVKVTEC